MENGDADIEESLLPPYPYIGLHPRTIILKFGSQSFAFLRDQKARTITRSDEPEKIERNLSWRTLRHSYIECLEKKAADSFTKDTLCICKELLASSPEVPVKYRPEAQKR